ncbi:MAG: RluA family pseudouridine synthase [Polyangiaceae bacterium]|nr:RluA family pseudouridine synthase [Polyangiaceae bacterium]
MTARFKRWIVRPEDGGRVVDILAKVGEHRSAIAEGRVFLGAKRITTMDARTRPGDEVRIGEKPGGANNAVGDRGDRDALRAPILFVKDGVVACNKPAGIPTVPDHVGASHSLVALIEKAATTATTATAAKNAFVCASNLRVTSRLDRDVSGVVLFATDPRAAMRLHNARTSGHYVRRYVAIAALGDLADVAQGKGSWTGPIGRGKTARHRAVFGPDAKPAQTHWKVVAFAGAKAPFALLAIEPVTGRTHQIRVHASHAGMPLVGDSDYGGARRITLSNGRVIALFRIALHAARVTVSFDSGDGLVAEAPIPADLARIWTELGGAAEAWDTARSCVLDSSLPA